MLLVRPYTMDREAELVKCRDAAHALHNIDLMEVVCEGNSWTDTFRHLWGTRDFIVLEHDIEIRQSYYDWLVGCPYSHCAVAYKLYPSPAIPPRYAHRKSYWEFIEEGCETARYVGFGLTKLSRDVQDQPLPKHLRWYDLDSQVSALVSEHHGPWHVHWPEVKHHHRLTGGKPYRAPTAASSSR